jgi:hypothetical protein
MKQISEYQNTVPSPGEMVLKRYRAIMAGQTLIKIKASNYI